MIQATKHVAVVGGGIVGVSTAEWLRRAGIAVTLIDRGDAQAAASFGNCGILARGSVVPVTEPGVLAKAPGMLFNPDKALFVKWSYLPRLLPWLVPYLLNATAEKARRVAAGLAPLLLDCVDQHSALAQGTPAARWIAPGDILYLYKDRAAFEAEGFGWALRREHGISGEPLEEGALGDYDPAICPAYRFGYRLADHGSITDPGAYVADLAAWFEAQGGVRLMADVTAITPIEAGVRIEHEGGFLDVDKVAICCGAWSKRLSESLGHRMPLESKRGYHVMYEGPNHNPPAPYMLTDTNIFATPMEGGLRAGGVVEFAGLENPPSRAPIEMLERAVRKLYPDFSFAAKSDWMGHRPATTDSLPVLGPSSKHPNIFFAFGHHHIGLTAGPKSGRLLADMIAGRRPDIDVGAYRIDRFA